MVVVKKYHGHLYLHPKLKKILQVDCKQHYRKVFKIPDDVYITDHIVLKSMAQVYLDREIRKDETE